MLTSIIRKLAFLTVPYVAARLNRVCTVYVFKHIEYCKRLSIRSTISLKVVDIVKISNFSSNEILLIASPMRKSDRCAVVHWGKMFWCGCYSLGGQHVVVLDAYLTGITRVLAVLALPARAVFIKSVIAWAWTLDRTPQIAVMAGRLTDSWHGQHMAKAASCRSRRSIFARNKSSITV